VRHADGHYIWFETRTRGVYDETTGEFLREVSVGRDVSERKENELRIRAAQDRAEAANRAKSAFLANMSHELRTPLNAVMGFADAMENELFGPLGNARYREYAASIRSEGQRLLAMVSNMLDVARIESGRFDLQPQMVDLHQAVDECFGFVSTAAGKNGITLERALPAGALWADASAVRTILLNLLSNAVKFTPSGGWVRVETAHEAKEFVLRVRDSGCGMTEEQLLRLSQPFAQLCSEAALARRSAGAGVGLALVRALTEAHGGCMHIDSAPGHGTTASLRFPARCSTPSGSTDGS
jgi:signal transduction histidine kinase